MQSGLGGSDNIYWLILVEFFLVFSYNVVYSQIIEHIQHSFYLRENQNGIWLVLGASLSHCIDFIDHNNVSQIIMAHAIFDS